MSQTIVAEELPAEIGGEGGLTPLESAIREADERLERFGGTVEVESGRTFDRGVEVTLRDTHTQIARRLAIPGRLLIQEQESVTRYLIQGLVRRQTERLMREALQRTPVEPPAHRNCRCVTEAVRGARPRPVRLEGGWRWADATLWPPMIAFDFGPVTPSPEDRQAAEARAEELLTRILTEGERLALDRLGVVPVIGGETGELVLVSKKSALNLLRYRVEVVPRRRGFGWLPPKRRLMPRAWCLTNAGGWAPWQDRVASIVTALRRAEQLVMDLAIRWSSRSLADGMCDGALEREAEPLLRHLAEDRCEDTTMLGRLAKALDRQGMKLA